MLRLKKYLKRSPYYYVRGTVAGQYVFETTETTNRLDAERYKAQKEQEIWKRNKLGERPPTTFPQAMTAYLAANGEKRYMVPLLDHFKDKPISEIGQVEADRAAMALQPDDKPSTRIRQVYGPLIAILNHALKAEMEGATGRKIKMPKVDKVPPQWGGEVHFEKLLPECAPKLLAFVLVSTTTGLRASEMLRQRRRDYEMQPGWLNIDKTKNGEPAFVPLTPDAIEAVAAILPDDPNEPVFGYKTVQGVNKALWRAAQQAKVRYLSTHQLGRHSFAARMLRDGADIKAVKEAGRWKKLSMVDDHYGHLEQKAVHEAMLRAGNRVKIVKA